MDFEFEFKKAAKLMELEAKIAKGEYQRLSLEDLSEACSGLDALGGIEIWLEWLYRVEGLSDIIRAVSKEGKKRTLRETARLPLKSGAASTRDL